MSFKEITRHTSEQNTQSQFSPGTQPKQASNSECVNNELQCKGEKKTWFVPLLAQKSKNTTHYWESINIPGRVKNKRLIYSLSDYPWKIFAKSTTGPQSWMWRKRAWFQRATGMLPKNKIERNPTRKNLKLSWIKDVFWLGISTKLHQPHSLQHVVRSQLSHEIYPGYDICAKDTRNKSAQTILLPDPAQVLHLCTAKAPSSPSLGLLYLKPAVILSSNITFPGINTAEESDA